MDLWLQQAIEVGDDVRAELRALSSRVYPADEVKDWPGRHVEWAAAEWRAFLRDDNGDLVSHAGLIVREAICNGRAVRIGGIGGVLTDPSARRRGYAERVILRGLEFFGGQKVDFGLLVCEARLLPYYGRLGWSEFSGTL